MTAPSILSAQHQDTTLYIIFDRAISVTGGSELDGFTFTLDPGGVITPSFSSVDDNALIATLSSAVNPGETLNVDYDSGTGTVVEAVAPNDPAGDFDVDAVAYFETPIVRRAETGSGAGNNDDVTIFFGEPVASTDGDLLAGITINVNTASIDLSSATASLNADQTELTISTGTNFVFSDTVTVDYDDSSGNLKTFPTGFVASFTGLAVTNLSTDGLPDSQYPNSFAVKQPLDVKDSVVTGVVAVNLNPVDLELVDKYGPISIVTGGDFGTSTTCTIVGGNQNIIDGVEVKESFTKDACGSIVNATDAAADWQDKIIDRISVELGALRTIDQNVTNVNETVVSI